MPLITPKPPLHPLHHVAGIALLTIFICAACLGLRDLVGPIYSRTLHITAPFQIWTGSLAIAAGLWWIVAGLRHRTPPLPLLRPTRARIIGTMGLWLMSPVGFGLGLPMTNLWFFASIILRTGWSNEAALLLPISGVQLLLSYLIASSLISLTRNKAWSRLRHRDPPQRGRDLFDLRIRWSLITRAPASFLAQIPNEKPHAAALAGVGWAGGNACQSGG